MDETPRARAPRHDGSGGWFRIVQDAIFGDAAARLISRPICVALVGGLTALYIVVSALFPSAEVAVPFAVVPLLLAAILLPAAWSLGVAAITYATVFVSEGALAGAIRLTPLELLELAVFGLVSLGFRITVTRLVLGRDVLDRQAVELASTQAQVAEARDATERWVAQLEAAQRAAARMSGQPTVEAVAQAVVDETRAIVDYHNCRVYLVEPNDDMTPVVAAGKVGLYEKIPLELLRTRVGEGFSGWVAQHGVPLLVPDANADPRGQTIPGTDDVDESMLVVPMHYDDRVIGVITLSKLGLRQFDVGHLRVLSILADHAATAVEGARALNRAQAMAEELRTLAEMSSALSESLDPGEVADVIARHMGHVFGVDHCLISFWDRDLDRLLTLGRWPLGAGGGVDPFFPLAGYPETRRVLVEQDASMLDVDDPRSDPAEVALLRRYGHRALVMLPLVFKGETQGLVELVADHPIDLAERRLDLARLMSNEAAMALGNAQLYVTARALADRDPLTGFFNHRYLHERLAEEILRSRRSRSPLAVLMLDLDDFKLVNDTLGHVFGDEILRWASEQIRGALRASDVPTRYGGDEFAVILPASTAEDARLAGERILHALAEHAYQAPGRGPVSVAASVGTAAFPTHGRTARELIAAADLALYRAKAGGGSRVDEGETSDVGDPPDDREPGPAAAGEVPRRHAIAPGSGGHSATLARARRAAASHGAGDSQGSGDTTPVDHATAPLADAV